MADAGAKIVRVKMKEGKTGLFFATSPDLEGLLVAEPTVDALWRTVPDAITQMYAACGERVMVTWVDNPDEHQSCVAVPVEVAKRALEAASA